MSVRALVRATIPMISDGIPNQQKVAIADTTTSAIDDPGVPGGCG
jgi:hypothetical protein